MTTFEPKPPCSVAQGYIQLRPKLNGLTIYRAILWDRPVQASGSQKRTVSRQLILFGKLAPVGWHHSCPSTRQSGHRFMRPQRLTQPSPTMRRSRVSSPTCVTGFDSLPPYRRTSRFQNLTRRRGPCLTGWSKPEAVRLHHRNGHSNRRKRR